MKVVLGRCLLMASCLGNGLGMTAPPLEICEEYALEGSCGVVDCIGQIGDPFSHAFSSTQTGYSLCRKENGKFAFLEMVKGEVGCGETVYDCENQAPKEKGLAKGLTFKSKWTRDEQERGVNPPADLPKTIGQQLRERNKGNKRNLAGSPKVYKNLVLLIKWSDNSVSLPSKSQIEYLMSAAGPPDQNSVAPTGSVDYFLSKQYYGQIHVDYVVTDWITSSYSEADAAGPVTNGNPCNALCSSASLKPAIREALDKAEIQLGSSVIATLDEDGDSWVDMITILHSGYGAESGGSNANRIWSHKWALDQQWRSSTASGRKRVFTYNISPALWGTSGSEIGRIGVIAHEMNHFIGLPDLYDTDSDNGRSRGIGNYGLMANSWGADGQQRLPGSLSAWSKVELGLVTPLDIEGNPGVYELPPVQDTTENSILRVRTKIGNVYQGDYLLVEYREKKDFDKLLGGGILIWHIDPTETRGNKDQGYPGDGQFPAQKYMVRLIQRDDQWDLERNQNGGDNGDFWLPGSQQLDDLSSPSLKNYELYGSSFCSGNALSDFTVTPTGMSLRYTMLKQDCSGQPLDQVGSPTPPPGAPTPSPLVSGGGTPTGGDGGDVTDFFDDLTSSTVGKIILGSATAAIVGFFAASAFCVMQQRKASSIHRAQYQRRVEGVPVAHQLGTYHHQI